MIIDEDTCYVVTNSLLMKPSRRGTMAAGTSLSRDLLELEPPGLLVLLAFSIPRSPKEALDELAAEWAIDRSQFEELVAKMIRYNLITPASLGTHPVVGSSPAHLGFASLAAHHHMLSDSYRVLMYRGAIHALAHGKTVVDIGCGTGVLSIFAAQAGARRVYAIEETSIADIASEMFLANGVGDRIRLIRGNSLDVILEEKADLVVHEILGRDPIQENILPVIADARRFLASDGNMIPRRLQIWCVGVSQPNRPEMGASLAAMQARQFSSMYGMSFEPLVRAVEGAGAGWARYPLRFNEDEGRRLKFDCLTEECLLTDIDLLRDFETRLDVQRALVITRAGLLAGVLVYFRAALDGQTEVSNSPFNPQTHWGHVAYSFSDWLDVSPGARVVVRAKAIETLRDQRLTVDLAGSGRWKDLDDEVS